MQESKITRNALKIGQSMKLSVWLTSKKDHPDWQKMNAESLATIAEKELGFYLTERNIRSVAKAIDLTIPTKPRTIKDSSKNMTRYRLGLLRKAVIELYTKLGENAPDYLNWNE